MTLIETQQQFAQHVALLIQHVAICGYQATLGEAFRTPEQQAIYVRKGLSKTSNSRHLHRLAIDLLLFKDGKYLTQNADYRTAAEFWVSLHPDNVAGFYWGWDGQHFERKPPGSRKKTA